MYGSYLTTYPYNLVLGVAVAGAAIFMTKRYSLVEGGVTLRPNSLHGKTVEPTLA